MVTSHAFCSESLIYRAIEDNESDKDFVHYLWQDPDSYTQHNYGMLLKPLSRKACDEINQNGASCCLIKVLICLPDDKKDLEREKSPFVGSRPIGVLTLHAMVAPSYRHHRNHDIGILIAPEHRGKGYGSEAMRWIINWGFEKAGLHRLGLQSGAFNTDAIKLWKRLGFKEDGRDREAAWVNGEWWDEVRFSMLEAEWKAMKAEETTNGRLIGCNQIQSRGRGWGVGG